MMCAVIECVLRNYEVVNTVKVVVEKKQKPIEFLQDTWDFLDSFDLPSIASYTVAMEEHFEDPSSQIDFSKLEKTGIQDQDREMLETLIRDQL